MGKVLDKQSLDKNIIRIPRQLKTWISCYTSVDIRSEQNKALLRQLVFQAENYY